MVINRYVKRLASNILKCGKKKIIINRIDNKINNKKAIRRKDIKKFIKNNCITKKNDILRSSYKSKHRKNAKREGRHKGIGYL